MFQTSNDNNRIHFQSTHPFTIISSSTTKQQEMAPIVISEEAKRAANLRVLQRGDPEIVDIVGSTTHVVLYEFNAKSKAWEKRNVEGSLFVAKRSSVPRFKMIVMNRSSKDNLEIPLASTFQMQVREPYLIFRMEKSGDSPSEQKIRGIWFHNGKEREEIVDVLNRVIKNLTVATTTATTAAAAEPSTPGESVPFAALSSPAIDRENAAASLMAALKIGEGSGSETCPPPSSQAQQPLQNQQQPNQSQSHISSMPMNSDNVQELNIQNMTLDKKSLQLSLMSLLQDDRFLDLIHAQYLKIVKARSSGNTPKK